MRRARALFVLNDRPDLVEACGADGVHIGRSDVSFEEARALVGPERLVGLSVSTVDELGDVSGADYVGVTAFARRRRRMRSRAGSASCVAAATLDDPVVRDRRHRSLQRRRGDGAGAPGVAVVRAIRDAGDPEAAARELRAALDRKQEVDLVKGATRRAG